MAVAAPISSGVEGRSMIPDGRRTSPTSAFAAVALFGLGVALTLCLPRPTAAARAPTVFVTANGDDANDCTRAAPCRSPSRAYRQATCSSIVQIAGGDYPDLVLLDYEAAKDSCKVPVTFIPSGAVVFRSVWIAGARHWKFDASTGGSFTFGNVTFQTSDWWSGGA